MASSQTRLSGSSSRSAVARAQRTLERVDAGAVLGMDREHEPVEEAAALAGRPAEQRVEVGRQPDETQIFRRRRRARSAGGAVDAAEAARPALDRRRFEAGAEAMLAVGGVDEDGDRRSEPGPGLRAISARSARRRPRPGANSDSASSRLVLPAPFSPASATTRSLDRQIERRVGAEVLQDEAGDAGAGSLARHGMGSGREWRCSGHRVRIHHRPTNGSSRPTPPGPAIGRPEDKLRGEPGSTPHAPSYGSRRGLRPSGTTSRKLLRAAEDDHTRIGIST